MKIIEIKFNPFQEGEEVSGSVTKQRKKGEAWTNEESITHTSKDGVRQFLLDDNQRLVVEAAPSVRVVYSKEQMAAVSQPVQRQLNLKLDPQKVGEDDFSPEVPADERAQYGAEYLALRQQEERDRAIQMAREKLKQSGPKVSYPEEKKEGA